MIDFMFGDKINISKLSDEEREQLLDAIRPKGRWIKLYKGQVNSYCSECGYEAGKLSNFCPECGSKLVKGDLI